MSETARARLAKQTAALIIKLGRWEREAIVRVELQAGVDLMRAQVLAARSVLERNSPVGIVMMMGELDEHHTDLGC